jgi:hypothetical protein
MSYNLFNVQMANAWVQVRLLIVTFENGAGDCLCFHCDFVACLQPGSTNQSCDDLSACRNALVPAALVALVMLSHVRKKAPTYYERARICLKAPVVIAPRSIASCALQRCQKEQRLADQFWSERAARSAGEDTSTVICSSTDGPASTLITGYTSKTAVRFFRVDDINNSTLPVRGLLHPCCARPSTGVAA